MNYDFETLSYKFGVSRETFLHLENYIFHLKKWQEKINLVSRTTLEVIGERHIVDSLQLLPFVAASDSVVDIGSGAGFPGMVLSISGIFPVTLVESDLRKVAFLREIARITRAPVTIIGSRIEIVDIASFSVVTCRAFMELRKLLMLLEKKLLPHHSLLLLKGENYGTEIEEASRYFEFTYENVPSLTHPHSVVSRVTHIRKRTSL